MKNNIFLLFSEMAKSLRSKWKRKMKAIKRVRYGEKERVVLEKMLDDAKASGSLKTAQDIKDVIIDSVAVLFYTFLSLSGRHGCHS